jgi:hypothetical protein
MQESFTAARRFVVLVALVMGGCGYLPRAPVERIMQDGNCAEVPDIERLAITVSDHGTKVGFHWSGSRFAGMVQTSSEALARDASYVANQPGEWERRFPQTPATAAVPGSYLGFPASMNAQAGVLAATVYETQYPAPDAGNRAAAVVDLRTGGTVLLAASRRVTSIAVSPKGDYVALVEITPASKMATWRDLLVWQKGSESPRYDVYATVYGAGGLVACTREITAGVPSPIVNVVWR